MADFLFVVKTFVITVILFLLLQIRVGSRTIEQQSVAWVHSSAFVETLQDVSDGAVHVVHVATHKVTALFTHRPAVGVNVGAADAPGSREVKRRAAKRAEARKQMTRDAVVENSAGANASAGATTATHDPTTGSFRGFFDVKTVHDADSQ